MTPEEAFRKAEETIQRLREEAEVERRVTASAPEWAWAEWVEEQGIGE